MKKEYTQPRKIMWAENPDGYDCLHNHESRRELSNPQIEQDDESDRTRWSENPDGYVIKPDFVEFV